MGDVISVKPRLHVPSSLQLLLDSEKKRVKDMQEFAKLAGYSMRSTGCGSEYCIRSKDPSLTRQQKEDRAIYQDSAEDAYDTLVFELKREGRL